VGREPQESAALDGGLEDEAEVAVLEVAEAAVDEAGGAAGGAAGEVVALHEGHAQAAQGGIAGGASAGDAAADDQDIKGVGREGAQTLGAGGRRRGFLLGRGANEGSGFLTHEGESNGRSSVRAGNVHAVRQPGTEAWRKVRLACGEEDD